VASGSRPLQRVSIDLTPLLPGGDNGGAKVVALALVEQFARLAPDVAFTLLTSAVSHDELAALDAPNVSRRCVDADLVGPDDGREARGGARQAARVVIDTFVPPAARGQLKDTIWRFVKRTRRARLAHALPSDLHFCPFTAPFYFDPAVPLVSLVHDLQYLAYPEFFTAEQRAGRHAHFTDAAQRAARLICVSEFVRQDVLARTDLPPERVQTIHSSLLHASRAPADAEATASAVRGRLGLGGRRYLLYPANPWPHKNHPRLIDAFAAYLRRWPDSDLGLVCTGAPGAAATGVIDLARAHLAPGRFAFAGYLPEDEFAALLRGARALIFPSLYEGFGLPLLEAMASAVPVLCSNTTSLPEVAGEAALLFDPTDTKQIVAAIEHLEHEPALAATLVAAGRTRLAAFGSARDMAARYLDAFEVVVVEHARAGARSLRHPHGSR